MIHHIQKSLQREKLVIKNGWGAVGTPLGFSGHPPGRMSPRRQKSLQRGRFVLKMVGVLSALPWVFWAPPWPNESLFVSSLVSCGIADARHRSKHLKTQQHMGGMGEVAGVGWVGQVV